MCSMSYIILRIDGFFPLAAPQEHFAHTPRAGFPVNRDFFGQAAFCPVNRDFFSVDADLDRSRTLFLAMSQ